MEAFKVRTNNETDNAKLTEELLVLHRINRECTLNECTKCIPEIHKKCLL